MAKKAEQTQIRQNEDGKVSAIRNTIIDDNYLPSADELQKYQNISKDIIPWIMDRVEKEQNARLKFNDDNMNLAKKDLKFRQLYDIIALILAFVLVIIALAAAIWLLIEGYNIAGTFLAGGTIAVVVYALLDKRKTGN